MNIWGRFLPLDQTGNMGSFTSGRTELYVDTLPHKRRSHFHRKIQIFDATEIGLV